MPHQRITIWGNSGSGKSTLAESVARELRLPVFHLDLIAWEAGWRFRDEATFLEKQREWLLQPGWIIEGVGGWHGLIERFHRSDLIVHLDTPLSFCHERAKIRMAEDRLTKNRFMAEGCHYGDVVELQSEVIREFEYKVRGEIEMILRQKFAMKPQLRLDGTQSPEMLRIQLLAQA